MLTRTYRPTMNRGAFTPIAPAVELRRRRHRDLACVLALGDRHVEGNGGSHAVRVDATQNRPAAIGRLRIARERQRGKLLGPEQAG
jgi:hypothetical protein